MKFIIFSKIGINPHIDAGAKSKIDILEGLTFYFALTGVSVSRFIAMEWTAMPIAIANEQFARSYWTHWILAIVLYVDHSRWKVFILTLIVLYRTKNYQV